MNDVTTLNEYQRTLYLKLVEMRRSLRQRQREAREVRGYPMLMVYMAQEDILEQAGRELGLE